MKKDLGENLKTFTELDVKLQEIERIIKEVRLAMHDIMWRTIEDIKDSKKKLR